MPLPMRRHWRRCSAGGKQGIGVPRRAPRAFASNMLSDSRPIGHNDRPRGSSETGEVLLPCGIPLRGRNRNDAFRTPRQNIGSLQAARQQPPAVRVMNVKLLASAAAGPLWLEIRPRSRMPAILLAARAVPRADWICGCDLIQDCRAQAYLCCSAHGIHQRSIHDRPPRGRSERESVNLATTVAHCRSNRLPAIADTDASQCFPAIAGPRPDRRVPLGVSISGTEGIHGWASLAC